MRAASIAVDGGGVVDGGNAAPTSWAVLNQRLREIRQSPQQNGGKPTLFDAGAPLRRAADETTPIAGGADFAT
jgi:hypothetical protein